MIWGDIMGTGRTEWGDADARSSIIIGLSVCGFHGDGARGRLCVNADGKYRTESSMGVHIRTKSRPCCRIITQRLDWEGGRSDAPRRWQDDADLVYSRVRSVLDRVPEFRSP
jgi:hypothetical protein